MEYVEPKYTKVTVIIGDYSSLEAVGIGPTYRRVTLDLTPEQTAALKFKHKAEELHFVLLENEK
jgi:hypothetical protein